MDLTQANDSSCQAQDQQSYVLRSSPAEMEITKSYEGWEHDESYKVSAQFPQTSDARVYEDHGLEMTKTCDGWKTTDPSFHVSKWIVVQHEESLLPDDGNYRTCRKV